MHYTQEDVEPFKGNLEDVLNNIENSYNNLLDLKKQGKDKIEAELVKKGRETVQVISSVIMRMIEDTVLVNMKDVENFKNNEI